MDVHWSSSGIWWSDGKVGNYGDGICGCGGELIKNVMPVVATFTDRDEDIFYYYFVHVRVALCPICLQLVCTLSNIETCALDKNTGDLKNKETLNKQRVSDSGDLYKLPEDPHSPSWWGG